ncbi:hypothetical protein R1sor_022481 [Riccia sorocarpa]|uniref:Uncharacterized protein n=1 Tax=Riccia sorocarpa TaxID=122646 RepID=A0ABD3GNB3_9MARC
MEAGPYMDTSTEAIRDSLRQLAEARHHAPPVERATRVDLRQTTAQEEERIRYYMQHAVFTVFYGSSPQLSQFQEAIDMSWKGGGVSIKEVHAAPRRGSFFTLLNSHLAQLYVLQRASPVIKGTPSVTLPWISEMEAATYEPPIKPTWVELPELPTFDKEVIQQLLSGSTFVRLLEEQLEAGIQSTRVEFMNTDQPGGGHQIPPTTQ